ncbi:MAG: Ig-like domain-containing protein [Candidatus Cloacimonetes bacterium]|nr:Ig-like domain-containing protein [Candidatus Cloacimonadota bacterium]
MINNASKKSFCVMYLLLIAILTVFLNCKDSNPVIPHIPVEKIVLLDTQISLEVGETRKLIAKVYPENATNQELIWASEDDEIAIVSDDGTITALSYGEVIIYISIPDEKIKVSCEVTVRPIEVPVTGVRLDQSFLTLNVGDSETLTATIEPENATNQDVLWSSSDESVVMISNLSSLLQEGHPISPQISPPHLWGGSRDFELAKRLAELRSAVSKTLIIRGGDDFILEIPITVTAISEGTAIITATSIEGGFIATCEVIVNQIYPDGNIFSVSNAEEWEKAVNGIKNSGNDKSYTINVINDFSLHGYLEPTFGEVENISVNIKGEKTITLISSGSLLYISRQQNISIDETSLEGFHNNNVPLVNVIGQNSSLTLKNNAEIKNNGHHGIYIAGVNTTLFIYGGAVMGNGKGGIFLLQSSELIMYEGKISDNGNINSNESFGGVLVVGESLFTMYEGSISGNSADNGAGVLLGDFGGFTMHGGTINENIVSARGGGVNIGFNSSFVMYGGSVINNFARFGGGVYGHAFFFNGGSISKNIATENGGGVWGFDLSLNGGIVSGNSAGQDGGGIYVVDQLGGGYYAKNTIGYVIIYGNHVSGVPIDLANSSGNNGASIIRGNLSIDLKYIDGTDVLPHYDGFDLYTDYTISLDLINIENNVNNSSNAHFDNHHNYNEYKE